MKKRRIELAPGKIHRMVFETTSSVDPLVAKLESDALAVDNRVMLLSAQLRPVRVDVRIGDDALEQLVKQMLASAQRVRPGGVPGHRAELIVTDVPISAQSEVGADTSGTRSEPWWVQWITDSDAAAYVGPFVMDRSHPLTQGLELEAGGFLGLRW